MGIYPESGEYWGVSSLLGAGAAMDRDERRTDSANDTGLRERLNDLVVEHEQRPAEGADRFKMAECRLAKIKDQEPAYLQPLPVV